MANKKRKMTAAQKVAHDAEANRERVRRYRERQRLAEAEKIAADEAATAERLAKLANEDYDIELEDD